MSKSTGTSPPLVGSVNGGALPGAGSTAAGANAIGGGSSNIAMLLSGGQKFDPIACAIDEVTEFMEYNINTPNPAIVRRSKSGVAEIMYLHENEKQAKYDWEKGIEPNAHPAWGLKINLANMCIGPQNCRKISKLLTLNTTVTTLDLAHCDLGNAAAIDLIRCLHRHNETLQHLRLSANFLQPSFAAVLSEYLVAPNCYLESIDLSCNSIGDEGATYIADALHFNAIVNFLSIRANGISDLGAKKFIELMQLQHEQNSIEEEKQLLFEKGNPNAMTTRQLKAKMSSEEWFNEAVGGNEEGYYTVPAILETLLKKSQGDDGGGEVPLRIRDKKKKGGEYVESMEAFASSHSLHISASGGENNPLNQSSSSTSAGKKLQRKQPRVVVEETKAGGSPNSPVPSGSTKQSSENLDGSQGFPSITGEGTISDASQANSTVLKKLVKRKKGQGLTALWVNVNPEITEHTLKEITRLLVLKYPKQPEWMKKKKKRAQSPKKGSRR